MAREYSAEETKEIIKKHKDLCNQIDELNQSLHMVKSDCVAAIGRARKDGSLASLARNEIIMKRNLGEVFSSVEKPILRMYAFLDNRQSFYECDNLNSRQQKINESLRNLAPAKSDMRWFFTGREKKELANQAFSFLKGLLESDYPDRVTKTREQIKRSGNYSWSVAREYFSNNRTLFNSVLEECVGSDMDQLNLLTEMQNLLDDCDRIDDELRNAESTIDRLKESIKNAVDKYLGSEVVKILQTVSVDELNRDKSGIRIKNLHEAGYDTIADIHYATLYNLESIPGISTETAYFLKTRAKKYADDIKAESKVRLSADNQTAAGLDLIKAIYPYKTKQESIRELRTLQNQYRAGVDHARTDLLSYKNELKWFCYSDDQKKKVIDAYQFLDELMKSSYPREVYRYTSDIRNTYIIKENLWEEFASDPIGFINTLEDAVPGVLGNDDSLYGLPEELARDVQEECIFPDGLKCSLRRYQEWGVKYALHQGNALLGDEMGLGKTVQAIATMVSLKNTGARHFIVVCPASVLTNWCREISEKSKLLVTKVHGKDRAFSIHLWHKIGGVAVTTYETTQHFKLDPEFRFSLLVVDEAHYIKNPEARRTKNLINLGQHAERLLFMTGTALENKVDEMIALIKILRPDMVSQIQNIAYMASAPQFRKRVAPVYYRRKREDVLTELPELVETKEWCELSPREEEAYERNVLSKNYAATRQVSWNTTDDLRSSCKAKRMLEIIEEAEAEGRKVLVFSFFLNTIEMIRNFLGDRCLPPINGSVPPQRRQEIIEMFDQSPAGSVLPAQIQSGGTGLNIQSASVVIICEPQLKPSIENQAISRAYRMGQARNVLVYRLLCSNTVDERIMDLLTEKQAVFDAFADKSVAGAESLELDDKTFGDIIKEEIERINRKNGAA